MFERFTDRARRVMVLSQEEARLLSHNYIGTEHLLLGLIHEEQGIASQVLTEAGISLEQARQQIETRLGVGKGTPQGHIPFTPRAKKVLELSLREALQLGHNYIGTEHILLGMLREGEGVGVQTLAELGAGVQQLQEALSDHMEVEAAQAVGAETSAPVIEPVREELPPDIKEMDERLAELRRAKDEAVGLKDFNTAAAIREQEKALMRTRDERLREWRRSRREQVREREAQAGPRCSSCRRALSDTAAYRILDVPEHEGDGRAPVLFLFCNGCGTTIDTLIAPHES